MTKLVKLMAAAVIALMPAAAAAQDNNVTLDPSTAQEAKVPAALPDSIIEKLNSDKAKIDALNGIITDNAGKISTLEKEKTELEKQLKNAKAQNDRALKASRDSIYALQKALVIMASNFLYVPYDKYAIEKIAVPAYEKSKGTPLYEKNIIRLQCLQEYSNDILSLVNFMSQLKKTMFVGMDGALTKAKQQIPNLEALEVYKRYDSYRKKYQNDTGTFLWKKMSLIRSILNRTDPEAYSDFEKIQAELKGLLKDQ